MPEGLRTAHEAVRSRPKRGGFLAALILTGLTVAQGAAAADGSALDGAVTSLGRQEVEAFTLIAGLICFAVRSPVVRARGGGARHDQVSRDDAMAMQAEIDRLRQLLLSQPQVIVTWPAAADEPDILGDTTIIAPGGTPQRVLAFGAWLAPSAAQRKEDAVTRLRGEGRGFVMTLT